MSVIFAYTNKLDKFLLKLLNSIMFVAPSGYVIVYVWRYQCVVQYDLYIQR